VVERTREKWPGQTSPRGERLFLPLR